MIPTAINPYIMFYFLMCIFLPLVIWIPYVQNGILNSHKKYLLTINTLTGIALIAILLMQLPLKFKLLACVWKLTLYTISQFFWKKPPIKPLFLGIPVMVGLVIFFKISTYVNWP